MQLVLSPSESPLRISPAEPFSVDDFFRFTEQNEALRCELEPNGDLTVMTPAHGSSGYLNLLIGGALVIWAEENGTGYALDSNTACALLDGSVRSPDAAWISATRWTPPAFGDTTLVPCPDFVIELRSATDRLKTLREKWKAGCVTARSSLG